MVVGVCKLRLSLYVEGGLKQKRSLMKRLLSSLRDRYLVSAAEVDLMDFHRDAVVGCSIVANDSRYVNSALESLKNYLMTYPGVELLDMNFEIMNF